MNSRHLAQDYLDKAKQRLVTLDVFFDGERYDDVIREAQSVVELVLKGLLRVLGVDPPRLHDVSATLLAYRERLPSYLADELPKIAELSAYLAEQRSPAFYGDEVRGIPPSELYGRDDAAPVRVATRHLVALYERALTDA